MGRPYRDHERLWTWQQHEEAVYRGLWQIRGWQQLWEAVICQHPMSKNSTHQQCVRRPESGTWHECVADGGRQHEEAVYRGLWQIRGLAAAM
ncbi:unnamed protein product, partial [Staurois parvus]